MKKFFVLFCIPRATIDKWTNTIDAAERTKQSNEMMQAWKKWMEEHEKTILDKGLPVGKTKRITANGVADARNDINWYLVVEAESHDAVVEIFKTHPHLQIPDAYIDVSDASHMGM